MAVLICSTDINQTNNGLWQRCRTTDTTQILTDQEFQTLTSNQSTADLFQTYFDFDLPLFSIIITASLLAWASGHVLGRMMQAWRKVM